MQRRGVIVGGMVCLWVSLGLLWGCASGPAPQPFHAIAKAPQRAPVILVPGITGSKLMRLADGELLWGEGRNVLRPKDGGYAMARPLSLPLEGPDPAINATAVIEEMRLFGGLVRKEIYGPVPEILTRHGYALGDLSAPHPNDNLFLFPYDWRSDNVTSAHRLARRLEALAQGRVGGTADGDPLGVDLVCQSNGAYICRYLAKYGWATLEEAEAGQHRPLQGVRVRKVILVGTSNGGAVRILREVDRGRTYIKGLGRKMSAEVVFTFPSIYQDLPSYLPKPFIDDQGQPLDWDLYDAQIWADQGWSIFDAEAQQRAATRPDLFADKATRIAFLQRCLDRARRLHAVLQGDPEPAPAHSARFYLLQNVYYETPQRAVVHRRGTGSELYFTGDPEVDDDPFVAALASAPGDGHATLTSQLRVSPGEQSQLAADPFYLPGEHFELITDPATLRRLMDFLLMD